MELSRVHPACFSLEDNTVQRTRARLVIIATLALWGTTLAGCSFAPSQLTDAQVALYTGTLEQKTATVEEPLTGPLDLSEAIARAIKYNANLRAQEYALALAQTKVRAQNVSLLPSVVAESSFYGRDKPYLSHSNLSPTYSTSADIKSVSRDLTLSLNILDFGLSYIRGQQAVDKTLKENEDVRRVASRIVEETRAVYWRAVTYDRLVGRLGKLQPEVRRMLASSAEAGRDQRIDPLISISYERDVLSMQRELNLLMTSLAGAKEQLKQLIGLPQQADLRFPAAQKLEADILKTDQVQSDVELALQSRFEIRQLMYDMRITDDEVTATIIQLLPGISLTRGYASDSNSYLQNANWVNWGSKIAWNLINLAHLPRDLDVVATQQQLNHAQAVAMAATIAMQVHTSRARLQANQLALADAKTYARVQNRMLHQVQAATSVGRVAPQALTKERVATLLAEVRAGLAHADLQSAMGTYLNAVGVDPLKDIDLRAANAVELATHLRQRDSGKTSKTPAAHAPERKTASL
jgi:outer membrane protein TolC